jgi:hypothetical protein
MIYSIMMSQFRILQQSFKRFMSNISSRRFYYLDSIFSYLKDKGVTNLIPRYSVWNLQNEKELSNFRKCAVYVCGIYAFVKLCVSIFTRG